MSNNKQYDETNRGSLFVNYDKKKLSKERDTSNWPNSTGKLNVYGVEFYVNGWTKVIKSGEHKGDRMQSISITPVDEDQGKKLKSLIESQLLGSGSKPADNNIPDDIDDDMPF